MSSDMNQSVGAVSELLAPVVASVSARDVLRDHLAKLRDELRACDGQVRRFKPDAVHQMRIATRQLCSALATFRPLLMRESTGPV
jgi:hypothetical protein